MDSTEPAPLLVEEIARVAEDVHLLLRAHPLLAQSGSVWVDWDGFCLSALWVRGEDVFEAREEGAGWWSPPAPGLGFGLAQRLAIRLHSQMVLRAL